eukprot:TRINITY_DN13715_c1_g1_i3.p1 TRINITY_DN13715_c1_g1~~TRINITY_DN13715_c1_g1_i3.p1  ORF type:complete len:241 (-),score=51.45 TRINITY_DN13715_c1_g1_i3:176-898(-)
MDLTDDDVGLNEEEEEFQKAADFVAKNVSSDGTRFTDKIKLQLYGYYKSATIGKCEGSRPPFFQPSQRAKWDAWNAVGEITTTQAMQKYVQTLDLVVGDWRGSTHNEGGGGLGVTVSKLQRINDDNYNDSALIKCIKENASLGDLTDEQVRELVNSGDEQGVTPLHWAVDSNLLHIIPKLIQCGADVNATDNEGSTPLHYAALCEFQEAFQLLISFKAQIDKENDSGEKPSNLAPSSWKI